MRPGERLFQSFDRVYVLNLPDRTDRRAEMAAELLRIGARTEDPRLRWFAAIRPDGSGGFPSRGARGCFLSHLAMLRDARDAGAERILILEDDCDFVGGIAARLPAALDRLDALGFDIFYGGYATGSRGAAGEGGGPAGGGPLLRADPALTIRTTHCVGFGRAAIEGLVPFLEAMLDRPPGSDEGGPMHVDGAYGWFRAARPELVCWLARPRLARQRPSRTDIARPGPLDRLPRPLRRIVRATRRQLNRFLP